MDPSAACPLILTALFDAESARKFQTLRDRHFPARLNIVPAHLTLFHALPGQAAEAIATDLRDLCRDIPPFAFQVSGLRFLGRGVALAIDAPALVAARARLAADWRPSLSAQDRQGFAPHVTVQNKVDFKAARRLHDAMMVDLPEINGAVLGLRLWRYLNGPWEPVETCPFQADVAEKLPKRS
ncbi:2'-5' RNA ligase family protein [Lichenihabitans psoromatis]|uniref:2'-5' RNA ligase family protein n=1 Tax=Lichenihabitans psoromatis TaxID=2528642 RepID=UPI001FE1B8CE|nr:2'-5' RNA ligase family protein [Lichenihabitans psoromatis]